LTSSASPATVGLLSAFRVSPQADDICGRAAPMMRSA
jgi:hypothetical protein